MAEVFPSFFRTIISSQIMTDFSLIINEIGLILLLFFKIYPRYLKMQCSEAALAHPCARGIRASMHIMRPFLFRARRDDAAWPPPVKRSKASAPALAPCLRPVGNAAMDEKRRAMDTAPVKRVLNRTSSSILGISLSFAIFCYYRGYLPRPEEDDDFLRVSWCSTIKSATARSNACIVLSSQ